MERPENNMICCREHGANTAVFLSVPVPLVLKCGIALPSPEFECMPCFSVNGEMESGVYRWHMAASALVKLCFSVSAWISKTVKRCTQVVRAVNRVFPSHPPVRRTMNLRL